MLVFSLGRYLLLSDISRLRIRRNIARMTSASTPPGDGLLKHEPVRGTVVYITYMIDIIYKKIAKKQDDVGVPRNQNGWLPVSGQRKDIILYKSSRE